MLSLPKKLILGLSTTTLVAASGYLFFSKRDASSPEHRARTFLSLLKESKADEAAKLMGSAGCTCAPNSGWTAYLLYQTGQEPNLAFLIGQKFDLGPATVGVEIPDPKVKSVVHRSVSFPVSFPSQNAPMLLPTSMAFGAPVTECELRLFCEHPQTEGLKGLTLRLRSGLEKGSIAPKLTKTLITKSQTGDPSSPLYDPEALAVLFGKDVQLFLSPQDPGEVRSASGAQLSKADVAKKLPRLNDGVLSMELVRGPKSPDWVVMHCRLQSISLRTAKGTRVAFKANSSTSM